MFSALLAGRSGLKNNQMRMDVIGNNIANMNTIGFKSQRLNFEDGFAQMLSGATSNGAGGSTNPLQIGSGARVGGIDTIFTQGALESTGQPLDLAIEGRSLFLLRSGDQSAMSRAGNFRLDETGRVVLGDTGFALQGVNADASGNLVGAMGDILLHVDEPIAAQKTTQVELRGNLDAAAEVGTKHALAAIVYDDTGRAVNLTITLTAQGNGNWSWEAQSTDGTVTPNTGGTVKFAEDGTLTSLDYGEGVSSLTVTREGGKPFSVKLATSGTGGGLVSRAGSTTAAISSQDGVPPGEMVGINIGADGVIQGVYSNGQTRALARVALANVGNPSGLERLGSNLFTATSGSGEPTIQFSDGSSTAIVSGALENSNVDISDEFTDMIVAQRGFQASARVVTTADELINELIHINR